MANFRLPKPILDEGITTRDLGDISIYIHSHDIVATSNLEQGSGLDHFLDCIRVAAKRHSIVAFDVGCNYGVQLCRMANAIKSFTRSYNIFAIDPGSAAELIPYTLLKNGLSRDVEFIGAAAWKESGIVEILADQGNSLNDRIVHGGTATSWLSPAISLREILDECDLDDDSPIFAKIDTQGADLEVLIGAGDYLERLVCVTELTPWACGDRIDVTQFIDNLLKTHWIFNLGAEREIFDRIKDAGSFVKDVYERAPYWTDILCVPQRFSWMLETLPVNFEGFQEA